MIDERDDSFLRAVAFVAPVEPAPADGISLGTVLGGKYLLEESIGRGGMAHVFAARHQVTGKRVAVNPRLQSRQARPANGPRCAARDAQRRRDRSLLILRVNERMEWKEIALVMSYDGSAPSTEVLQREAARLRKRFQLVKERLRELAAADGLLGESE